MIFTELVALGPEATIGEIAGGFDEEAIEVLEELLAEEGGLDRASEIVDGSINCDGIARSRRASDRDRSRDAARGA